MCFYLGQEYDLKRKQKLEQPVMYDAKDLTTHGVVVGMTGSGKTGLCITLLEEAAIDGIPSIIIDPKGDLTNLLLQFPDLDPKQFQKWLNPNEAKLKNTTPAAYAKEMANTWKEGLENSLQTPDRIKLLKDSSEWRVYTPGSEAGLPLSILKTFSAPEGNVLREQLNQRIDATATALLGLTGIVADPVQSREHILIAQILLHSWSRGKDIDLQGIIQQIQLPPMDRIGAFDVETFYPEKERLKLAVALNNILAAPSFSTWVNGEPLDLSNMMYTEEGKPRQLIFYVAHLEESQRLFFITLLLEEVLNWTRKQPGTSTLRALLYFDEVYGYLPPHPANPPTKLPLMTMLKQARAFGVGVLLATQNPVDIDYKALSNAGTWMVGKLQTERDKARLIEGLESVAAEQGSLSNRQYLETVISSLGKRVFLLHNVHRGHPVLFQTRQTLSFLRGPMTRDQVAQLMEPMKKQLENKEDTPDAPLEKVGAGVSTCIQCQAETQENWNFCAFCGTSLSATASRMADQDFKQKLQSVDAPKQQLGLPQSPPEIDDDVPQFYFPLLSPARPIEAKGLVYKPRLYAVAEILFTDRKVELYHTQQHRLLTPAPAPGLTPAWHVSERASISPTGVAYDPAHWEPVPETLTSVKNLKSYEKNLIDYLYTEGRLVLYQNKKLALLSSPGEKAMTFLARCRMAAQKVAEKAIEEEKIKYRPRFVKLGSKLPEGPPAAHEEESAFGFLNPLSWFGSKDKPDDKVTQLQAEWYALQSQIYDTWKTIGETSEDILIKPLKKNIQISVIGLAWTPYWHFETATGVEQIPAWR